MKWLLEVFNNWSTVGIKVPFAYDSSRQQPSMTLFFTYLAFLLAIASDVALHFAPQIMSATITANMFFFGTYVLYLIRNLQRAKVSLQDKSFELQGESDVKKDN